MSESKLNFLKDSLRESKKTVANVAKTILVTPGARQLFTDFVSTAASRVIASRQKKSVVRSESREKKTSPGRSARRLNAVQPVLVPITALPPPIITDQSLKINHHKYSKLKIAGILSAILLTVFVSQKHRLAPFLSSFPLFQQFLGNDSRGDGVEMGPLPLSPPLSLSTSPRSRDMGYRNDSDNDSDGGSDDESSDGEDGGYVHPPMASTPTSGEQRKLTHILYEYLSLSKMVEWLSTIFQVILNWYRSATRAIRGTKLYKRIALLFKKRVPRDYNLGDEELNHKPRNHIHKAGNSNEMHDVELDAVHGGDGLSELNMSPSSRGSPVHVVGAEVNES